VISKNPVSRVRFLQEENEQTRVVTYKEQAKYLLSTNQPLTDIATLMLETGMRPEEVYRIQVENVHLDKGFLFKPVWQDQSCKAQGSTYNDS